jgi:DNA-binding HxlR family transcriptional regulator
MQDGTSLSPGYPGDTTPPLILRRGNAYAADCPTRALLDRVGDKWSVLILLLLGEADTRFNGLKRRIGGVSQKMLSQTLRSLERDGLLRRDVEPTTPVSVTYRITPLGRELLGALRLMIDWAETRMPAVVAAQTAYDRSIQD